MVPLLFSVFILGTGFLFTGPDYRGVSGHILDLGSAASAFLVYGLARAFESRLKKSSRFANLALIFLAGSFAAFGADLSILILSGGFDPSTLSLWPIGAVAFSLNLATSALVWAGYRLGRSRLKQLRQHQEILVETQETLEEQIDSMRGEIRDGVDAELNQVIELLDTASGSTPAALSTKVLSAIDEVIRPLSHRLAGFRDSVQVPRAFVAFRTPPAKAGVSLARLAGPEFYAVLFLVFIVPASFQLLGVQATVTLLGLLVVQVANLVVLESRASKVILSRWLSVAILVAQSALYIPIFMWLVPNENSFGVALGFSTVSLAVSIVLALVSRRVDELNRLDYLNFQLQQAVATLRQEAWVLRTSLAKAVHGSVQAKFLAVGLRLAAEPKLNPALIDQVTQEIRASIEDVSKSVSAAPENFRTQLDSFIKAWDGVVSIGFDFDDSVVQALDAHPFTAVCVAETLGEAISNAAKHSNSPSLRASLVPAAGEAMELTVSSQGKLSPVSSVAGYGSHILDEVTNGWSLRESDGELKLSATFFLSK